MKIANALHSSNVLGAETNSKELEGSPKTTSRLEEVKYFRDRICDFKSKTVHCCKGQTPPLSTGHIEFLKQFSFKPGSPSTGIFRASVIEH